MEKIKYVWILIENYLQGWATSIVVIAIMIVSLINSGSTSMSCSERQENLLRETK